MIILLLNSIFLIKKYNYQINSVKNFLFLLIFFFLLFNIAHAQESIKYSTEDRSITVKYATVIKGVKLNRIQIKCNIILGDSLPNRLCDSWIETSIVNSNRLPQKYLVLKVNIYDTKGNKLTNNSCFIGYELVDLGKKLPVNRKIYIKTYYRRYLEYGKVELTDVKWHGLKKPDINKVYPEIKNDCP